MEGQKARRMGRRDRESPNRGAAALRGRQRELACEILHHDLTPGESLIKGFPPGFLLVPSHSVPFVHFTCSAFV